VQRQCIFGTETEGIHDDIDFFLIDNLEDQLSGSFHAGENVKIQIEGSLEQFGQQICEVAAFGDDFDAVSGKTVAVEQNAEALRQSAAIPVGENFANFRLCAGRK
jgi:uncharacterized protein YccT (UPF0319 family)